MSICCCISGGNDHRRIDRQLRVRVPEHRGWGRELLQLEARKLAARLRQGGLISAATASAGLAILEKLGQVGEMSTGTISVTEPLFNVAAGPVRIEKINKTKSR